MDDSQIYILKNNNYCLVMIWYKNQYLLSSYLGREASTWTTTKPVLLLTGGGLKLENASTGTPNSLPTSKKESGYGIHSNKKCHLNRITIKFIF